MNMICLSAHFNKKEYSDIKKISITSKPYNNNMTRANPYMKDAQNKKGNK
jgi:hypothetical protein